VRKLFEKCGLNNNSHHLFMKTHLTQNIILEFEEIKLFICDDFLIIYDSPISWQYFGMEMIYSKMLDMPCYLPIQQNEARRLFAAQRISTIYDMN
jgi:hypothetical protein